MVITYDELLALLKVGEDHDLEFKKSTMLPKDVWPTYSAFANTDGGAIILGIKQTAGDTFEILGLDNVSRIKKQLWDILGDRKKISVSLLNERDVQALSFSGKNILVINVPQANRRSRPVYIDNNPLTGTYKRRYEGDYRCDEVEVKGMLRDASDEPFDSVVYPKYDLSDIDIATLNEYRNRFHSKDPDHPYLAKDDKNFLAALGGWRKDRDSGKEGLTLAGLLVFGKQTSIKEALPYFNLDYREELSDDPEIRWTHRITLDGRWEGNLFNFYYRVYNRLVNDVEVPFKLAKDASRIGITHVHEALREAFVNTLVHADHAASKPIIILKQRSGFSFSNPGRPRISLEQMYAGGVSDCRNPRLQTMFQMIGLVEKAGSGFQKILRAWNEQHWFIPLIREDSVHDTTSVFLPTVSIIPQETHDNLVARFGKKFTTATEMQRMALAIAHKLGRVSNTDLQRYYNKIHPVDISKDLHGLVENSLLRKLGNGRATSYVLVDETVVPAEELATAFLPGLENLEQMRPSSEQMRPSSEQMRPSSEQIDANARAIASPTVKKKINSALMDEIIFNICRLRPFTLRELATLLNREPVTLRTHYVNRMIKEKQLTMVYPNEPNNPNQAYKAITDSDSQ